LLDRFGQRFADPRQLKKAIDSLARKDGVRGLLKRPHGLTCRSVGPNPKRIGTLHFQKIGNLVQLFGDVLVTERKGPVGYEMET
jgi:hypothetical protein